MFLFATRGTPLELHVIIPPVPSRTDQLSEGEALPNDFTSPMEKCGAEDLGWRLDLSSDREKDFYRASDKDRQKAVTATHLMHALYYIYTSDHFLTKHYNLFPHDSNTDQQSSQPNKKKIIEISRNEK